VLPLKAKLRSFPGVSFLPFTYKKSGMVRKGFRHDIHAVANFPSN